MPDPAMTFRERSPAAASQPPRNIFSSSPQHSPLPPAHSSTPHATPVTDSSNPSAQSHSRAASDKEAPRQRPSTALGVFSTFTHRRISSLAPIARATRPQRLHSTYTTYCRSICCHRQIHTYLFVACGIATTHNPTSSVVVFSSSFFLRSSTLHTSHRLDINYLQGRNSFAYIYTHSTQTLPLPSTHRTAQTQARHPQTHTLTTTHRHTHTRAHRTTPSKHKNHPSKATRRTQENEQNALLQQPPSPSRNPTLPRNTRIRPPRAPRLNHRPRRPPRSTPLLPPTHRLDRTHPQTLTRAPPCRALRAVRRGGRSGGRLRGGAKTPRFEGPP